MLKRRAQKGVYLVTMVLFLFFAEINTALATNAKNLQWPLYEPYSNCSASNTPGTSVDSAKINIDSIVNKYNLQSAIIQEVGGGVVAEFHSDQPPITPASTMKLIIADVALRSGVDLNKTARVTPDIYYAGGNELGASVTLKTAMQRMLSSSSNVGANVLMKELGGVGQFTQKAHSYDYKNTNVGGYYDPSNDSKNSSTIADEASAMNHIFSKSSDDYVIAQKALEEAAQIKDVEHNHYNVDDDANKWAGTSTVGGNVGKFKEGGKDYIVGVYINKAGDSVASAIKGSSEELAHAVTGATSTPASPSTPTTPTPSTPASATPSGPALPSDITNAVKKNKAAYQKAAQAADVPWQLIAALHYRETGLSTGNPNIFQITGYSGGGDLASQATSAGNFLQKNAVPGNLPENRKPLKQTGNDPEEIKDTLFSYNGRAQVYAQQAASLGFSASKQPYEGSPYVMNNYDTKHHNMGIITHDGGGVDGTDTRYGAFAIYAGLGGDVDDTTTSAETECPPDNLNQAVPGSAVKTAINYAWPDYHPANYCTERETYKEAIKKARANGEYTGGDCDSAHIGIDCGGFITRVMRDSGTDPNYNWGPSNPKQGNTVAQQAYLEAQVTAGKYEKVKPTAIEAGITTGDLQPGDIAINGTHTYMYVGKQSGFHGNSASASFQIWRAPMASNAYGLDGEFTWYRLKSS
jgi:D-alanyl-D-alanine carboxypeptidase